MYTPTQDTFVDYEARSQIIRSDKRPEPTRREVRLRAVNRITLLAQRMFAPEVCVALSFRRRPHCSRRVSFVRVVGRLPFVASGAPHFNMVHTDGNVTPTAVVFFFFLWGDTHEHTPRRQISGTITCINAMFRPHFAVCGVECACRETKYDVLNGQVA